MHTTQVENVYELSAMQAGLFFHSVGTAEPSMYFEQSCFEVNGLIDATVFRSAWQLLIDRHDVLRTSFHWEETFKPVQVVHTEVPCKFVELDRQTTPEQTINDMLEEYLRTDRSRPFDLTDPPLLRVSLITISAQRHFLVVSFHHLLLDGWSAQILYSELDRTYQALRAGQRPEFEPTRHYVDFIAWQQERDRSAAERFWQQELSDFTEPTPLPCQRARARAGSWCEKTLRLPRQLTDELSTLARSNRLTLNTLIHGAYAILLSCYTGHTDVVFGSVVSGRPPELDDVEKMVGLFINTVAVRVNVTDQPVIAWLADLQECQARRSEHEWAPLVEVQRWSEVASSDPLFHTVLAFENYPTMGRADAHSNADEPSDGARYFTRTNYPLNLAVSLSKSLTLTFLFDDGVVDAVLAGRMLDGLLTIMGAMVAEPTRSADALPVMSASDADQLMQWSLMSRPVEPTAAHRVIEAQVDRSPEQSAVVFGQKRLTYRQLDDVANALAHRLIEHGAAAGTRVGVYLDRSCELVVAMLAVFKSGAAFVPLDPSYPRERINQMIKDADLAYIVCAYGEGQGLPVGPAIVTLGSDTIALSKDGGAGRLAADDPNQLAYLIYTSGSTGCPKAVSIEHTGLANLIDEQQRTFGLGPQDKLLQFSSLSFDAFIFEVFMALATGATLCIGSRFDIDPGPDLAHFIAEHGITALLLPPSALRALPTKGCETVRVVAVAGEACPADLVERWLPGRRFFHLYGPTEASIWSTVAECFGGADPPPIGRPIANTSAYVLDTRGGLAPIGAPGELNIGGVGVARGYFGRPTLTAERFVPDPFTRGSRLYRTGDLVRWNAEDSLEFLGRVDDQIKLRGFRIEPGEVESVMRLHPDIVDAVVVMHQHVAGDHRLVGYFVPKGGAEPGPIALLDFLRSRLPDFMVPNTFVALDALPLMPNGKVDRRGLPAVDDARPADAPKFVEPTTTTEETVVSIWAETLGVERIGIDDNFFDLGGHSLLATQVTSRSRQAFDVDIPISLLFESGTPRTLAASIDLMLWSLGAAPSDDDGEHVDSTL